MNCIKNLYVHLRASLWLLHPLRIFSLFSSSNRVADTLCLCNWYIMNRRMTKPTKWHVRPAKTQISLIIVFTARAWRNLVSLATHWAHSEDSDQPDGWLGWAMVVGSFQCRGVLLLLHIVGQGPAVGYIFYIFRLSSLSNVLSFGRRLNITEILWFRLLNPNGNCQLLPRTSSLSTG